MLSSLSTKIGIVNVSSDALTSYNALVSLLDGDFSMRRDETPRSLVPTLPDKERTRVEFLRVAEQLLPQLTDAEWEELLHTLIEARKRLREVEFDQRIGYFV